MFSFTQRIQQFLAILFVLPFTPHTALIIALLVLSKLPCYFCLNAMSHFRIKVEPDTIWLEFFLHLF